MPKHLLKSNIMKRSIYQKLLLSLMLLAFFGTLASAQVMSRTDVDAQKIEAKKQLRVTKHTPTKRTESETTKIRAEKAKQMRENPQLQRKVIAGTKTNVKAATLNEVKLRNQSPQNIYEKAKQITPPPGYKVVVTDVNGKKYIEYVQLPDRQGINPVKAKN